MKKRVVLGAAAAAVLLFLSSCDNGGPPSRFIPHVGPSTTRDITGFWVGEWASTIPRVEKGRIQFLIVHTEQGLAASLDWNLTHCINHTVDMSGKTDGRVVQLGLDLTPPGKKFSFEGTRTGDQIAATYRLVGGGCEYEEGTFSLSFKPLPKSSHWTYKDPSGTTWNWHIRDGR